MEKSYTIKKELNKMISTLENMDNPLKTLYDLK